MKVAISQSSPIWMNKKASLEKAVSEVEKAAKDEADLIIFGEGFVPGYPFWVAFTEGAKFDSNLQKEMFTNYHKNAVNIVKGDLWKRACGILKFLKIK